MRRAAWLLGVALLAAPTVTYAGDLAAALRALEDLRSVVRAGLNQQEHHRRVLDARVVVDRYLAAPTQGEDEARRAAIRASMDLFVSASSAWNNSIALAGWFTGSRPTLLSVSFAHCYDAESRWEGSRRDLRLRGLTGRPAAAFDQQTYRALLQDLWVCAGTKLTEAQRGPEPPRAPVSAAEADRQLRGVLEREGAPDAKCTKKQYGASWVTVCE